MTERKAPVPYGLEIARSICEHIADGRSIVEISEMDGFPSRNTIYRWLAEYPKFFDAFERAKEVSAMTFEEKALAIAHNLEGKHTYTAAYISGLNYAMQQYRWTAARRNKTAYGQQQAQLTAVPITINTTLNLGQEGMGPASETHQSIYTIEATAPHVPAEVEGYEEDTVSELAMLGEVVETPDPTGDNALGPTELERSALHYPKVGRKRRGHKSPAQAAATASRYARKKKENGTE